MADENEDGKLEEGGGDPDVFTETLNAEDTIGIEQGADNGPEGTGAGDGEDNGKGGEGKSAPTVADLAAKMEALEAKNTELEKAARRAFYNERHEKKEAKGKEGDATLSDAELTAIIEANKDDPKVMLNAVTYKMQQMMKAGTKAAVDEVAVKGKNDQLSSYVRQIVPDFDKEGSDSHESIMKVRGDFALDDHPHGDFLAWAAAVALQLPQVKQASFEAGKKAALEGKAEDGRKSDIKGGQPGPSGKKGNGLTGDDKGSSNLYAQELETFDRIFGHVKDPKAREAKLKLYRDQIKRGSNRKAA